jgi:hypothetical protein
MRLRILVTLACLLLLLLWPVIVWHDDIAFDKLAFVNGWLNVVGSGLVIAFVFAIGYRKYSEYIDKANEVTLMLDIGVRIAQIIALLNEAPMTGNIPRLWSSVSLDFDRFRTDSLKTKVLQIKQSTEFEELNAFFNDPSSRSPDDDIRDVIGKLNSIRSRLKCM